MNSPGSREIRGDFVNAVIELRVHKLRGISSLAERVSASERLCSMESLYTFSYETQRQMNYKLKSKSTKAEQQKKTRNLQQLCSKTSTIQSSSINIWKFILVKVNGKFVPGLK
jgi:hypothetical protein